MCDIKPYVSLALLHEDARSAVFVIRQHLV